MEQNNAAIELRDLLATRNFDPELKDVKTGLPPVNDKREPDDSKANQFIFHFRGDSGEDYGTVEILLADHKFVVGSGNNTGRGIQNPEDKQSWYDFLLQLKNFAVRNDFKNFDVENISRMKYLRQSMAQLTESIQGRGQYSWSGQPTEARMLIKHSRRLGEGDARHHHIDSIFLETVDGERYRLSTRSLAHGRAMLEHVRAGGRPWDTRGAHINFVVEQLQILSRFRRAHQGRLFEGEAASLIEQTNNYFASLRRNLKSMATGSGYKKYFESWNPDTIQDQELVVEDLRDLFVETRVDPRIEQALPLLAKIKEHSVKEADIFEAWANRLTEGTWALPDTDEKMTKLKLFLSQPQPVGADADNVTSALGDILGDDTLFDRLEELAENDPDADARPVVQAWLNANQNYPEVRAITQELESEPDVDQELSMTAQDMPDSDSDVKEGDNLANPLEEVLSPGAMAMFPEDQGVAEGSLNEFAPGKQGGGGGDYLRALASAWYNDTFNTGSLQKGIKSQEDVERVLARGIVCPDGKTRKYNIDYNGDFDGVQIYSDDYYEHGDVDGSTDTRTGRPFGPYDHIEFKGQDLDEGMAEGAEESVSFREMVDVVDQHHPSYYAELSGSDISDEQFKRAIINAYRKIIKKQGVAEGQCNMTEAGENCPVHGMTECYMETVHTDPKGFAQPTGAAFESQLARIQSLALLR